VESGIPYPRGVEYLPVFTLSAAVVAIAAAAYSARAWPIGVRSRVQALEDRVLAAEAIVEDVARKARASAVEQAEFLEAAEGVLDAVETKRRRIAARQSAENRKNGAAQEPEGPEGRRLSLLKIAREQGHAV